MIRALLSLAAASFLFTGCSSQNVAEGETPEQKVTRYNASIEGLWKWKPIPTQTLLLAKGSSLYVIDGKADRDTGSFTITLENPNPKAAYLKMAEVFSAGKMVFLKNDKKVSANHTVSNRKKVYAILGMKSDFMQMMDTESGTIWEYTK